MNDLAIELKAVNKRYSHFDLQDINLNVPKGEIMGFIGPNGAGKSTTIRIIMGLLVPDSGSVTVLGHPIPQQQSMAKWDIGFASDDMNLYKGATLQWHMDFMRSIYDSWDQAYANTLIKRFDLIADQQVKGFSHGQRVKAGLLLSLARRPKLLVLDEPTTGLDPVARKEITNELMSILQDDERTILFSSHHTQDVEQLSDRITFIDRGKILKTDDKENYLDSWRRLRVELPSNFPLDQSEWIDCKSNGKLTILTTDHFSDLTAEKLKAQQVEIHSVETMSLEEIFVAQTFSSRQADYQGDRA